MQFPQQHGRTKRTEHELMRGQSIKSIYKKKKIVGIYLIIKKLSYSIFPVSYSARAIVLEEDQNWRAPGKAPS